MICTITRFKSDRGRVEYASKKNVIARSKDFRSS